MLLQGLKNGRNSALAAADALGKLGKREAVFCISQSFKE